MIEEAVAKYGIKTLIDLRAIETAPDGTETESDWAKRKGLFYFNFVDLMKRNIWTGDQAAANFMAIVTSPTFQPVLLHCHHGRSRTAGFVALYRVTQQGWTVEQAFAEMRAWGDFPSEHEHWLNFLEMYKTFDWKKYATLDPSRKETIPSSSIPMK
jgi:protein tyrosine/serine phosphatase